MVQRLWREEGLRVIVRRRRKRAGSSTAEPIHAGSPDIVRAVDSQFDATENSRPVRPAPIVDEHTCECLGGAINHRQSTLWRTQPHPGRSSPAESVTLRQRAGGCVEGFGYWVTNWIGIACIPACRRRPKMGLFLPTENSATVV